MGTGATRPDAWKEVGWNGLSFQAPKDWDPGKIGRRYLLLEREDGPVLEVKWGPVKGSFSLQKHLRRLHSNQGKQRGVRFEIVTVPEEWKSALGSFETAGFRWRGPVAGGNGVILYCPRCRIAALVQFYNTVPRNVPEKFLGSYRDHRGDGMIIWAVFDIRAIIPESFRLIRHRFEPGRYELAFASGESNLTLYRWGPAAALMNNGGLVQFAAAAGLLPDVETPFRTASEEMLEWESVPGRWGRFFRKPQYGQFRIWIETEKNRILAIRLEGKNRAGSDLLNRIGGHYETV